MRVDARPAIGFGPAARAARRRRRKDAERGEGGEAKGCGGWRGRRPARPLPLWVDVKYGREARNKESHEIWRNPAAFGPRAANVRDSANGTGTDGQATTSSGSFHATAWVISTPSKMGGREERSGSLSTGQ